MTAGIDDEITSLSDMIDKKREERISMGKQYASQLREERVEDRAKALLKTMDLEETAESIQKAKENLKALDKVSFGHL